MSEAMGERVAVVETKVEAIEDTLKQVEATQQEILLRLTKYQGAWGSIAMIGGAIVACLQLVKQWWINR